MTIPLYDFIIAFLQTPALQITTILLIGTIIVNGATDAPNAIASLVASGGMELKPAVRMAAVFNFAGLALMSVWNANVAYTICHMVDFGNSPGKAQTALCAALTSIILWSAAAWCFGIPTSESHALIAGLTGAAIAIHNGLSGINGMEWIKVLYGLAASGVFRVFLGLAWGQMLYMAKERWDKARKGPGTAKEGPATAGTNRRGGSHGVHAWGTGWTEVHGSISPGYFPVNGKNTWREFSDSPLDDIAVQCGDGGRNCNRRGTHHQKSGHRYGKAA